MCLSLWLCLTLCDPIDCSWPHSFYSWVIFHSMICHILFIHSSLDQHLCCFHLLDIVDTVSMNIGVQISVWFPAFNTFVYTEVELLHQILILCCCCCFWWSIVIFSAVTVPFYIPTSKAQVVFQYPYMQVNNCLLVGWLVFFIAALLMHMRC